MKSHLKVKVYSLMTEMTYIRRQEEKWKTKARIARQRQKENSVEYAESNFWTNHWHRHGLKGDARVAHLAYGCMRGVSYARMENICYGPLKGMGGSEPNWTKIEATVERFSRDEPQPQNYMQAYAEWLADAKKWYEGNRDRITEMWTANKTKRLEYAKKKLTAG